MDNYYDNISDFELALVDFELAVAKKLGRPGPIVEPFDPGDYLANLRARLISEEADETFEALVDGTKAHLAKELADLLYVTFGTAVKYGIPIRDVFFAVHDNNMLKINNSTIDSGGKLVKAKDHPKVDLSGIVR